MYYPKHQIKKVIGDQIPVIQDSGGNTVKLSSAILTGDGKIFKNNTNALTTGNFNGVEQYFRPEIAPKQVNEKVLTQQDIDYSKDSITRYFIYNKSKNTIKELSKNQYILKKQNKRTYETLADIEWKIKGPVDDVFINDYLLEGAETINRKAVEKISKDIPGIKNKINNYSKFVKDVPTEGIKKVNYKPDTDKFYIPSPS